MVDFYQAHSSTQENSNVSLIVMPGPQRFKGNIGIILLSLCNAFM